MLELLTVLYRASRAETSVFLRYAVACTVYSHAKRDHLLAINKTRAHPAHTQPDCFFHIHNQSLQALTIGIECLQLIRLCRKPTGPVNSTPCKQPVLEVVL